MTLTTPNRRTNRITWTAVQRGLWVGNKNGEFAGMIESRWGEGFSATTSLGKQLGSFPSMEEAKASFPE